MDLAKELGLCLTGSASLESFPVPSYGKAPDSWKSKDKSRDQYVARLVSFSGGKFLMLPGELRIKEEPALGSGWSEASGVNPTQEACLSG